jgi:hypothetical protein
MSGSPAIVEEKAIELCREYCEEHGVHTFSQCWGCLRFSKGEPARMCFAGALGNRGCRFVNKLFEEENK